MEEGAGDILPRTRLLDVLGLDAVGRSRQLPLKLAELLVRVGARVRVKAIGLGFGMGLGPGLGLGLGTRVRVRVKVRDAFLGEAVGHILPELGVHAPQAG